MTEGPESRLLVEISALRQRLAALEAGSSLPVGDVLRDAAEALWESAEHFRATFEQAAVGIAHIAPDGRFLRVNRKLCDIIGHAPDELSALSVQDITHPGDLDADLDHARRMLAGEIATYSLEKRYFHRGGGGVWVNLTVSLARESDGRPKYFIAVVEDITARKQAETLSHLDESRLNSLLALSERASELAEQDIVILALEEAVRLTRSRIGYFHFVNDDQKTLNLFAWSRETLKTCTAAPENHYPLTTAGVWADCARLRRPVIHNDYQNLPDKRGYPKGHSHLIRHMSVPVIEQDKVRLIIGVGNKPDDYDEADARQLLLVAGDVWKIVCRRRAEARILRLNRFYATLSQTNKALIRIQDRAQLFRELHRIASECELFAAVWIGLLDPATGKLKVVAGDSEPAFGLRVADLPCLQRAMSGCCVIDSAMQCGAAVVCNDLADESTRRECREAARLAGIRACVALPIREQGQSTGVFMAYSAETEFFDSALVNLLREMVDDISFGLDTLRAEQRVQDSFRRLERAMLGTIEAVTLMSELRDPYTAGHEHRVGELAAALGAELGLGEETIKGLGIIGRVHDIGKITIPAEILSKPGRLSPLEFEMIKTHVRQGYEILRHADFPWPVAEAILQHHERLDGSGYPQGLRGEQIGLEARIVAVADVVEAMASHRPYRPGRGVEAALAEIDRFSGVRYDPAVAAACLRLFRERDYTLLPHHTGYPAG